MLVSDSIKVYNTIELLKEQFNTTDWYLIKEEQSIFPNAKEIITRVCRYMYANVENSMTKRTPLGLIFNYEIPYDIFKGLDVFFEGIDLKISFFMMSDGNEGETIDFSEFSKYNAKDSWLTPSKKLFNPEIAISYKCQWNKQYYSLIEPLTHELTHAYEDYCRLLHKVPSLINVVNQPLYDNIAKILQDPNTDKISKAIANIFYMGIKSEQNAFVAEVHSQMINAVENEMPEHYKTDYILKRLPIYQYLQRFNENILYLQHPDGKEEKDKIWQCITQITGKTFKTFDEALYYLIDYNNKMQENILKKVGKIIYNYKVNKGVFQKNNETNPEFRIRNMENSEGFNDFEEDFDNFYNRISKY